MAKTPKNKSTYSIKEGDPCPVCKQKERDGVMVKRHGRYGEFLGCSKFPQCSHVSRIKSDTPSNWDLIKQADAILGKEYKLI
jgi:ssDNA-binding Zn-finger/Zn-ribbon topoisomerase 1